MERPADRLALLAQPAVLSAVRTQLGWDIEYHERIGSTQDRARALAAAHAPLIVVADEQTAGKGRHGSAWIAPAGSSLLASWAMRWPVAPSGAIALLAGVAVARALEALGARGASLKWPNDVQLRERKVAGVLADATSGDPEGSSLVLGIGVNVRQRELPGELADRATSLALEGLELDRLALLARVTAEIERVARSDAERAQALDEWRRRAPMLGREVSVVRVDGPRITGVARSLGDDGALVLETAGGPQRILAGEVTIER